MIDAKVLDSGRMIKWCPGCGNFGTFRALKDAIVSLGLRQDQVVLVAGIGCSGTITNYIKVNTFHTLHGRVLPVSMGIKLVNPRLTVIGSAGDGDAYAIGVAHLIHAARKNIDITYIVHNNKVYGLTTGQASPTSDFGQVTRSTPIGALEEPVNPLALALSSGATFVARGFAGDVKHLTKLIIEGIKHKGFALIDVLQPCVVWDRVHSYSWYRERVYDLNEEGHDTSDIVAAFRKSFEWGDRIPIGIFYKVDKPTYEERLPQLKKIPIEEDLKAIKIKDLIEELI